MSDVRFQFGKNWLDYLPKIDEERVHHAVARLHASLGDLTGKSFLDVGCGSGIHSLAAVRLGACRVHSFDFDQQSVDCARATKRQFAPTAVWEIERGSALDETYLIALGHFDFIYSWGVLHHTGNMWRSLELLTHADVTTIMISLYADQGLSVGFGALLSEYILRIEPTPHSSIFVDYYATIEFPVSYNAMWAKMDRT